MAEVVWLYADRGSPLADRPTDFHLKHKQHANSEERSANDEGWFIFVPARTAVVSAARTRSQRQFSGPRALDPMEFRPHRLAIPFYDDLTWPSINIDAPSAKNINSVVPVEFSGSLSELATANSVEPQSCGVHFCQFWKAERRVRMKRSEWRFRGQARHLLPRIEPKFNKKRRLEAPGMMTWIKWGSAFSCAPAPTTWAGRSRQNAADTEAADSAFDLLGAASVS